MLKRVGETVTIESVSIPILDAEFPAPFKAGLEYSSPARGTWNIVHTGMLIPEAHLVFVCALGCLRGVVLTAAEMNALDRYSAVQIREENVLNGGMEELMIEGISDVIEKLDYRPRAVEVFISCQHFFMGYDQKSVYAALRERFPDIHFVDCYMIPTLRKSGMTPDQRMRIQLYRMWEPVAESKTVNLIGSNLQISPTSELVRMAEDAGYEFWDLYRCKDFDDYMAMAGAALNLVYEPVAVKAAEDIKKRLGTDYLYLPFTYDFDELKKNYERLAEALGTEKPDFSKERQAAEAAIAHARETIGDTPVAVDYTFTFKILSFTRMLLENGFNVRKIYADAFSPEEEGDFEWIKKNYPDIKLLPTNQPEMRFLHHGDENIFYPGKAQGDMACGSMEEKKEKDFNNCEAAVEKYRDNTERCRILAVGQKAAYFAATDHFVNVAESGGYYGYDGIRQVMGLMEEAFSEKKDRKTLIQRKGYGCESCL